MNWISFALTTAFAVLVGYLSGRMKVGEKPPGIDGPEPRKPRPRTIPEGVPRNMPPRIVELGGPGITVTERVDRDSEAYVRWLQSWLNSTQGESIPLTGSMDQATRTALAVFERKYGFDSNGISDGEVEAKLMQLGASAPPTVKIYN